MGLTQKVLTLLSQLPKTTLVAEGITLDANAAKFLSLHNVIRYIEIGGLFTGNRKGMQLKTHNPSPGNNSNDNRIEFLKIFDHDVVKNLYQDIGIVYLGEEQQSENIYRNMEFWYPNLREGGVIVIDSFSTSSCSMYKSDYKTQVQKAVHKFCHNHELNFYVVDEQLVIHKPYKSLLKYKDIHNGQRVFLVGNGPSLRKTNLDLIKNEYSIGMNRISLLYSITNWRPSYYIYTADNINNKIWGEKWKKSVIQAVSQPGTTSFVWRIYANNIQANPNIVWLDSITEFDIGEEGTFSTNFAQFVSKTGTSMNVALQLAFFMGFKEIFLLGCDMNWQTTKGLQNDPNHFDPSYSARIPDGEKERQRMRKTHKYAYAFFKSAGREVYNATIDTLLDIYPLANYEKVAELKNWVGTRKDEKNIKIIKKRIKMFFYWKFYRYWIQLFRFMKTASLYVISMLFRQMKPIVESLFNKS